MRLDHRLELAEPLRRQRRQKAAHIAEMMRRRRMADARALGHRPQRESLDPALGQLGLSGRQQGRAQIAVMIGPLAHAPGIRPYLASVKIFLDGRIAAPIILTVER